MKSLENHMGRVAEKVRLGARHPVIGVRAENEHEINRAGE